MIYMKYSPFLLASNIVNMTMISQSDFYLSITFWKTRLVWDPSQEFFVKLNVFIKTYIGKFGIYVYNGFDILVNKT